MKWRFRRRVKIAPGVSVNLSNSSAGVTVGGPAGRLSVNTRGQVNVGQSIPGTGVYWQQRVGAGKGKKGQPVTLPAGAVVVKKRHGCLYYIGMGLLAFLALGICGALASIFSNDTPAGPERAAIVDVSQETPAATPASPPVAELVEATATATNAPPTATNAPPTATNAPPTATDAPPPVAEPVEATATPAPVGPAANTNANLREGPGTDYPIVGSTVAGQALEPVGRNSAGDWLQLASGTWIAAALVDNPPADLPVTAVAPVAPTAAVAVAAPGEAQPNAFTCVGGCATPPDPSCTIKGNVNSKGELIYHMPGWRDYNRTDIKPEEGDRWFCTAEEAQAAGFRAPQNP